MYRHSIDAPFMNSARRQNQFVHEELAELLALPALAQKTNQCTGHTVHGEDKAEFSITIDPKAGTFSLYILIVKDKIPYVSTLEATRTENTVFPNLYEIKSLIFDNEREKLTGRFEISHVLAYMGKEMIGKIQRQEMPCPHENKGCFNKFWRFINRHMPDEATPILP